MIVYEVFDGWSGSAHYYGRKAEAVAAARDLAKAYTDDGDHAAVTLYRLHLIESLGRGRDFAAHLLNGEKFVVQREEICLFRA